jgi:hypothetical protein
VISSLTLLAAVLLLLLLQVADYESLLRRVIRRAPSAGLMSFSIFAFNAHMGVAANGKNIKLPAPYYNTGTFGMFTA